MSESEGLALAATLRALRRRADLSQRQLAERAGVPCSTVARIEAGRAGDPRFRTVERLVTAAGGALVIGVAGEPQVAAVEVAPHDEWRDEGGRHYPAHLDVREVNHPKDWAGAWWAHWYELPPERWPVRVPTATYDLCRERRDRRRWREKVRRGARLRRVTGDLPEGAWQWIAELPDREVIGELRAHRRCWQPSEDGRPGDGPRSEIVLDGVVVAPHCRGAGVGRRLVTELAAEMERAGMTLVRAVVDFGAPADFLHACGFRAEFGRPVTMTLTARDRRDGRDPWDRGEPSG